MKKKSNKENNKALEIVEEVEKFAKKNPMTTIVAAGLLGYTIGRLLHKRKKE